MKQIKILLVLKLFMFCITSMLHAQQSGNKAQALGLKQQSIVVISALAAKGELLPLEKAFNAGLDAD